MLWPLFCWFLAFGIFKKSGANWIFLIFGRQPVFNLWMTITFSFFIIWVKKFYYIDVRFFLDILPGTWRPFCSEASSLSKPKHFCSIVCVMIASPASLSYETHTHKHKHTHTQNPLGLLFISFISIPCIPCLAFLPGFWKP